MKSFDNEPYVIIYGLSANPVHQGHIDLLTGALSNLLALNFHIKEVLIIPVYRRNPVGSRKDYLPGTYEKRVRMCELASKEVSALFTKIPVNVSRVEEQLATKSHLPNYTSETLAYLKTHTLSDQELIFLISSELVSGQNPEFSCWFQIDNILKISYLAICPRPGFPLNKDYINQLTEKGGRFIILDKVRTPDISSTMLRKRLTNKESPLVLAQEGLIPMSIAQYLDNNNLYQDIDVSLKKAKHHH